MRKIKYTVVSATQLAILFVFILLFVSFCYAQTNPESHVHAPEPGTIALITTGIGGWLLRFARKRFKEFKRFFDITVGAIGLVAVSPIMILTAIFIKAVSPGPVLYRQERLGYKGRKFYMYKMRTMKVDAEKDTGPVWAQENDPRLIKFGKLIRKMHLDEFPQLFNVLRGEMSIIGPRPERPCFSKQLESQIRDYRKRLNVKPGITGLAQVVHKYDETVQDVKKKVKFDLLYIKRMCFMVDFRILLLTAIAAATGKGAR
jgi:lipopolysaccharide/colanic/teichoic acid biosynthesis glycosyltransferase